MEATRKFIQTVRFVLVAAVVMYLLVILRLPSSAASNPSVLRVLGAVALIQTIIIFVMTESPSSSSTFPPASPAKPESPPPQT